MLLQIDESMKKQQFRKKLFGKQWNTYTYQPLVRQPFDFAEEYDSEDEEEQNNNNKFDSCKIKLDIDFNTKKIMTSFFLKDTDKKTVKKLAIKKVSDLDEHITFESTIRMVVTTDKLWASKGGNKRYGVTMKMLQMEITPNKQSGSLREQFSKYAFDDNKNGKYALIDSEDEYLDGGNEYSYYSDEEDCDESEEDSYIPKKNDG